MKRNKVLKSGLILSLMLLGIGVFFKSQGLELESKIIDDKLAVYIKSESGNYEKSNSIPTSGYVLNTEKSTCNNGAIPSWSNNNLKLSNLSGNTSCYLYFDEQDGITSLDIIAANNPSSETPDFSQAATTDEGVFKVNDGMYGGYSYYWRGAATTNYVRFAGKCWRIVRINGDGSTRLIYDGTTCHDNGTSTDESIAITSQAYNTNSDRSEYVGYTFTEGSQRGTTTESNLKTQTESWFNTNIIGTNANKVAEGNFCNDREMQGGSWSSQPSSTFYYAGYGRSGASSATTVNPTLACSNANDKYTLKVGAIAMDEVIMAGAKWGTGNDKYYLYNGQYYWTISPYLWYGGNPACVFSVSGNGNLGAPGVGYTASGVRPVINLKSDVKFVSGGNGTINNPYVVEGTE